MLSAQELLEQKNGMKPAPANSVTQGMKTSQTVTQKEQGDANGGAKTLDEWEKTGTENGAGTGGKANGGTTTAQPTTQGNESKAQLVTTNNSTQQTYNTQRETTVPDAPQLRQAPNYDAIRALLMRQNEVETPEQQKKRERRERTEGIIRAVGDGISALARLYYGSQGAQIKHDNKNDLTAGWSERLKTMSEKHEKNKQNLVNGYINMAKLQEEARKNDNSLAETIRNHNLIVDRYERTGDQKDVGLNQKERALGQKDRQLNLQQYKYDTDAEYKDAILTIKKQLAAGQISHWQATEGIQRLRATKAISKGGDDTNKAYWYRYYELLDNGGRNKIDNVLRKIGKSKVDNTNIRYIMDSVEGKKAKKTNTTSSTSGNTRGGNNTRSTSNSQSGGNHSGLLQTKK